MLRVTSSRHQLPEHPGHLVGRPEAHVSCSAGPTRYRPLTSTTSNGPSSLPAFCILLLLPRQKLPLLLQGDAAECVEMVGLFDTKTSSAFCCAFRNAPRVVERREGQLTSPQSATSEVGGGSGPEGPEAEDETGAVAMRKIARAVAVAAAQTTAGSTAVSKAERKCGVAKAESYPASSAVSRGLASESDVFLS